MHFLLDSTSKVQLNIISSLSLLNEVIGAELLTQSLLPVILDLVDDGKWRIWLAVIERILFWQSDWGTVLHGPTAFDVRV